MKKITMLLATLCLAFTMQAEVIKVDTLTAVSLGIKSASATTYGLTTQTTSVSGAQYAAFAYGKQDVIQIRSKYNTSGVVSTTSAGYIKSVQIIQNSSKDAKNVDIYASNNAFASPSDLYDESKATKVGNTTSLDQTVKFVSGYKYVGVRADDGTRYLDKLIITWTDTEPKGKQWVPDTITVSEAVAIIRDSLTTEDGELLMNKTHYVKGVVTNGNYGSTWPGYAMIWMNDIENPGDSLEGFKIYKDSKNTKWNSADEIPCYIGDTIMLFANGLALYKEKMIYETTSGYFVEVLGKAKTVDANNIYNFAVGAVAGGESADKYLYELILSRTSVEGLEDAIHLKFKSYKELGIAGKYTIYADGDNASYDDSFGPASGQLEITFVSTDGEMLNHYKVKSSLQMNDAIYTLNKEFDIAGWYSDYSDQFLLEDDLPWVPDTITVSEAIAIIRDSLKYKGELLMKKSHYITGVVSSSNFGTQWPGYATVWMTDVENPADEFEGFKIYKDASQSKWSSAADIPFSLGDTIMLFADALSKYNKIYETTSGYYAGMIGKVTQKDANSIFKYAYGAVDKGANKNGTFKYEVVLARAENDYSNAAHFVINSIMDKSLTGSYTIAGSGTDSSYVDGDGPVSGSMTIKYVSDKDDNNNTYYVAAKFQVGGMNYTLDTTYVLKGYNSDRSESFVLENDRPYYPSDSDTITCTMALRYARALGTTTSSYTIWVKGYATGFNTKLDGRAQQSVYMSDTKGATNGIFEGYLCYTQNLDSILKGDEVLVKGNILYYASQDLSEISKGKIYRIGGSDTKRPRTVNCVEVPAGAISVDSALAIGKALIGTSATTPIEYTVCGYIAEVNRQVSQDSATWYMADTLGAYGDFKAYRCAIPTLIDQNDMVFVTGKISKFINEGKVSISISNGAGNFACKLPTGIVEQVAAEPTKGAKKVMMNGQMFILKDGVLYNALGAKVQK